MVRLGVVFVVLALAAGGCGDDGGDTPSGTPRSAVLGFLDDLEAGRVDRACAALDPSVVADLRLAVLPAMRPPEGLSREDLRRWIRERNAATKQCPYMLRQLAAILGERLAKVRADAATAPVTKPFPTDFWALGDQAWGVEPGDGAWAITIANALADATPPPASPAG